MAPLWSNAFPLGKTGGLIEAARDPCVLQREDAGFRWVKPAASLKQGVRGVEGVRGVFPLGKTGGLIEAMLAILASCAGGWVSAG